MKKADQLKASQAESNSVFNRMRKGTTVTENTTDTLDAQDTQNISGTKPTKNTGGRPKAQGTFYRFNLKMPSEYEEYLRAAAYRASNEHKTVTITEYICELIRADKERYEANNG